jgi:hypothetical protein
MFDELDDPQGVPTAADRIDVVKAAARRQRARRRGALGVALAVALAVPIAAIAFGGDSDRPVETAADDTTTTTTVQPTTTTTAAAALEVLETTTTTTEPPTTTTVETPPKPTTTAVPVRHDRSAAFEPFDAGVAGEAWADPSSQTTWRIGVTMRGLQPGVRHVISVQEDTGSFSEIRPVCDFTSAPNGTGACTGEHTTEAGPPGQVSAAGYDPTSPGYKTVAYAYFRPFPNG